MDLCVPEVTRMMQMSVTVFATSNREGSPPMPPQGRSRRNGMGDIFQGMDPNTIHNISANYHTTENTPAHHDNHPDRHLSDDNSSENSSTDNRTSHPQLVQRHRRNAMSDIFTGIDTGAIHQLRQGHTDEDTKGNDRVDDYMFSPRYRRRRNALHGTSDVIDLLRARSQLGGSTASVNGED